MGQCPSTTEIVGSESLTSPRSVNDEGSGGGEWDYHGQNGECLLRPMFSVQPCLSAAMGSACAPDRFMMSDESEDKFLRVHESDPPDQNIVPPDDVDTVLAGQTRELVKDLLVKESAVAMDEQQYRAKRSSAGEAAVTSGIIAPPDQEIKTIPANKVNPENMSLMECSEACAADPLWVPNEGGGGGGDVLHLTMTARMSEFYRDHYRRQFTASPAPKPARTPSNGRYVGRGINSVGDRQSMADESSDEVVNTPSLVDTPPDLSRASSDSTSNDYDSVRVKMARDGASFLDLAVEGSLGMIPDVAAANIVAGRKARVVLVNQKTRSVKAVCMLKSQYGPPEILMHSTKPRFEGQKPVAERATEDGKNLYPWAMFSVEGEFPLPVRYSIFVATQSGGYERAASYRASQVEVGIPSVKAVGRTSAEKSHSGCCLVSLQSTGQGDRASLFSIAMSRGVDPALFICFTAILDELLESTMRRLCQKAQRKARRSSSSLTNLSLVRLMG